MTSGRQYFHPRFSYWHVVLGIANLAVVLQVTNCFNNTCAPTCMCKDRTDDLTMECKVPDQLSEIPLLASQEDMSEFTGL